MTNLCRAIFLLVILCLLIYAMSSLPLLYYDSDLMSRLCKEAPIIDLHGLTLLVGDLHASGASNDIPRFRRLAEYTKTPSVSSLVVLGDLFGSRSDYDSLVAQSGDPEEAVRRLLDALGLLGQKLTVYLILGDPVHDPQDLDLDVRFAETRFVSIGKCRVFHIHRLTMIALHGDQAFGGPVGFTISILARNLLLERLWKERAGIPSDNWVIMAHTHVPGIDYSARVANTGGWTETPLIRAPSGMGVVVDERANISLVPF